MLFSQALAVAAETTGRGGDFFLAGIAVAPFSNLACRAVACDRSEGDSARDSALPGRLCLQLEKRFISGSRCALCRGSSEIWLIDAVPSFCGKSDAGDGGVRGSWAGFLRGGVIVPESLSVTEESVNSGAFGPRPSRQRGSPGAIAGFGLEGSGRGGMPCGKMPCGGVTTSVRPTRESFDRPAEESKESVCAGPPRGCKAISGMVVLCVLSCIRAPSLREELRPCWMMAVLTTALCRGSDSLADFSRYKPFLLLALITLREMCGAFTATAGVRRKAP